MSGEARGKRRSISIAVGVVAILMAIVAPAASGAPRTYDSQITGFVEPTAVTVGGADQIWVSDTATGLISQWSAYPSQTKLSQQDGGGRYGGEQGIRGPAVSAANGFLFAPVAGPTGSCGAEPYFFFDNFGNFYREGELGGFPCQAWAAADNSATSPSRGRFYLWTRGAATAIYAFDGYGNPVSYSASASYINGNQIKGTPGGFFEGGSSGSFDPVRSGITVDSEGNIWVVDTEKTVVDEFAPTGRFIRTIKGSSVPGGFGGPFGGGLSGIAIDPTDGNVLVIDQSRSLIDEFDSTGKFVEQITGAGTPAGSFAGILTSVAVNSQGYMYVADPGHHVVDIFAPRPPAPTIAYKPDTNPTATSGTVNAIVDPHGGGPITSCRVDYGTTTEYETGSVPCVPDPSKGNFTVPTEVGANLKSLTTETTYHYRVVVADANGVRSGTDQTYTPHAVIGLRAEAPSALTPTAATLNGSFVGNAAHTTYFFEWGPTSAYGNVTATTDAGSPAGPGRTPTSASISGLVPGTQYHFRVVASNGSTSASDDLLFKTPAAVPQVRQSVSNVHSDGVAFHAAINPGGDDTVYHFEYGPSDCSNVPDPCTNAASPNTHVGSNNTFDPAATTVVGLAPGTLYHFRVIATNGAGTSYGPDSTFTTYPFANLSDACPNLLARQQTGGALLPDCRAYELTSSAHAGGYDVESNLVPGQTPFEGFPLAENPPRVLYGVHSGAIPGTGNPTNRGVDPYIATRSESGWSTQYVGVPANAPSALPFSSTLAGADADLASFAFGGDEICSPCFADGSSGIPIRLANGALVQGMIGSIPVADPESAGEVRKPLSADGSHLVFGSEQRFEPAGNPADGNVTIYSRDLPAGVTEVVSTNPAGATLADGSKVAELDMSEDGSRTVIGDLVSETNGIKLWHLYMHVAGNPNAIDLTPGTTTGAVFNGMTAAGSTVYFTTVDPLTTAQNQDTDTSADLYRDEIGASGATLSRVSTGTGGTGNTDACTPVTNWNVKAGNGKCGTVALAGGAGVAADAGTVYFLSPEQLDGSGNGEAGQANLYVSTPGASTPKFVALLDSSVGKPGPAGPGHGTKSSNFVGGLTSPGQIAVDQSTGEVYVLERGGADRVSRFTSAGAPSPFSTLASNQITGQNLGSSGEGQIAVDSAPSSPLKGALYVTTNGEKVKVYGHDGAQLGELSSEGEVCGVSVDQTNGDVYLGRNSQTIFRYHPLSAAPLEYGPREEITAPDGLCNISDDSNGHVYAWPYQGGTINRYLTSTFSPSGSNPGGTPVGNGVHAQNDPQNGDLYVDEKTKITRYDVTGAKLEEFGANTLIASLGVAVNRTTKTVYASSGGSIVQFELATPPYRPIDNPAVVDAVEAPETHHYGDFQATPDGTYAVFDTVIPLDAGFANAGHDEIYRYDAPSGSLRCISCNPTGSEAVGDATLASGGLSLTNDGRVFFDSTDVLALRDADNRKDVYEWEEDGAGTCSPSNPNFFATPGTCVGLISAGSSPFDSSLLSADASGNDAYFFTHDVLAGEDQNGPVTKIYDARTNGGFFRIPPPALCAASDECHGPSSEAPPPPNLGTRAGGPGNLRHKRKCKKGSVSRHGKCVKAHGKKKRKHKGKHKHAQPHKHPQSGPGR